MLLHGWEGSARSSYILSVGSYLRTQGYEIFRLNFRDHGESHHLNEELFHSCRLPEVVGAVGAVADRFSTRPLFLVGFSLGGNFALRVAARAADAGLPLTRVVAVSPVIDPRHSLEAMENGPAIYRYYFMRKWRRSMRRKQSLFPDLYDFSEWMRLNSLREQTRYLAQRYAGFESLEVYLQGYSVAGSRLAGLQVPATIITAADDPIIPVRDFRTIEHPDDTSLEIHDHGGHCGFLENLAMRSWIDPRIGSILNASAEAISA